MDRDTVVSSALNAYTLTECLAAEKELIRWLKAYPDDLGLHEIAGELGIVKAAAVERETKSFQEPASLVPVR